MWVMPEYNHRLPFRFTVNMRARFYGICVFKGREEITIRMELRQRNSACLMSSHISTFKNVQESNVIRIAENTSGVILEPGMNYYLGVTYLEVYSLSERAKDPSVNDDLLNT